MVTSDEVLLDCTLWMPLSRAKILEAMSIECSVQMTHEGVDMESGKEDD